VIPASAFLDLRKIAKALTDADYSSKVGQWQGFFGQCAVPVE
jgi:hypothetical protein